MKRERKRLPTLEVTYVRIDVYLGPIPTSVTDIFAKIVNDF